MTLKHAYANSSRDETAGIGTPRVRLKPNAHAGGHVRAGGHVDGAWWPHSDDLTTELADLLEVLSSRLRAIDRVTYNVDEWTATPAELVTGGYPIRLEGYRHRRPPNTLELLDATGNKIVLLVVPSHTDPDHAHTMVMAASAPDNVSSVDTLLSISEHERDSRTRRTAAQERWESRAPCSSPNG